MKEYAEAAHRANEQGKILVVVDGELVLQDPPPPTQQEIEEAEAAEAREQAQEFLLGLMEGYNG